MENIDLSKIAQIIFNIITTIGVVLAVFFGKNIKKNPPKLPIELHLNEELTTAIKEIRENTRCTEQHTASIASKFKQENIQPQVPIQVKQ